MTKVKMYVIVSPRGEIQPQWMAFFRKSLIKDFVGTPQEWKRWYKEGWRCKSCMVTIELT